jgi:ketosteroid isomerase-like protein
MRILLKSLSVWVLTAAMVSVGCAGEKWLTDYQPTSQDEVEIKTLLLAYEDAWNQHDKEALLPLLADDFVIVAGSSRRILFSKSNYAFELRNIMRQYRYIALGVPSIWLEGDAATVSLMMAVDGRIGRTLFRLTRKESAWYFQEWQP